jgi:hypothetical protein
MTEDAPNAFETALLESICRANPVKAAGLADMIPDLIVLSREQTGVGSFTSFRLPDLVRSAASDRSALGSHEEVALPGLKFGLGILAFLEQGFPHLLETYTYGEAWNGEWEGFKLVPKPTAPPPPVQ